MNANREHKNSVFCSYFDDMDRLKELYAALSGHPIPPEERIEINTLSDALFNERINDLSFTVGNKVVVLVEHQSTINPNMALRLLIYIARVYEKIIDKKAIHTTAKVSIPAPEFYVLYNGVAEYPDEGLIKLSNSYRQKQDRPPLELEATVYNINEGRNRKILERSKSLADYSVFIEKVREELRTGKTLDISLKDAVYWCIENGVMPEYLEANGSEVRNMLLSEWNLEDALQVREEDGYKKAEEKYRTLMAEQQAKFNAQLARQNAQLEAAQRRIAELERLTAK
jgi:hypothetical protein